jgi:arylsulfatase A-like enzyme
MTDDQGYGDVAYLGNKEVKTPNLDDMAQSGLRLDRFYTAPVCSPTRASVLTGRYPTRAGVFSWGHALRPQEQSIAKVLKNSGYQTGFFGKYHLGSIRAEGATSPGAHGFDTWYAAPNFYENDPWMSKNGKPVQLKGEGSDVTVELALAYIESAVKEGAPFIVFIWLGSPHLPHEALDELKSLYPDQPENMKNYYGEMSEEFLNEGQLNSPDLDYPGLEDYPYSGSFAWIDNQWKLHQNEEIFEWYDLEKDPKEGNDLAGIYPDKVGEMKQALLGWQNSVIKSMRGEDYKNMKSRAER